MSEVFPAPLSTGPVDAGKRLDQLLASRLGVSRARIQELIAAEKVLLHGKPAKSAYKLRGGEQITILCSTQRPPLRAVPEPIPLDILYEDDNLAVVNKPAGMMVHAGAGATDDARNRGTLVNALLHHFASLSNVGGELRPGIVHRLDKETSGLIVVAKNDEAHRKLAQQFARREVRKTYIALVHGWLKQERGTIARGISRDRVRRTRMTTRHAGGREAITHYHVLRRLDTGFGKFTLLEVKIDTGRTHQIRVHLSSLGHAVVGDTLYGAPGELRPSGGLQRASAAKTRTKLRKAPAASKDTLSLPRNFLHAAELEFQHPRTREKLALKSPLPVELQEFMAKLER